MDNWGLIGVVKESGYYQVYNIKIEVPRIEAKSGVETFFDSILGEESPKEINYSLVNGTKDCAWIPTSEKMFLNGREEMFIYYQPRTIFIFLLTKKQKWIFML